MNYQYQYKKQIAGGRPPRPFAVRFARQLSITLCILLVVVMFKYVKTGTSELINGKVEAVLKLDYTDKLNKFVYEKKTIIDQYFVKWVNHTTGENQFYYAVYPLEGKITSGFGERTSPITKKKELHNGIDLSTAIGTNVKAVSAGVVEKVEDSKTMGLTITINHNNGYETIYGHLSQVEVNVGEDIPSGSVIAKSGNSGISTGPHLHFEVHEDTIPVDPSKFLNK